MCEYCEESKNRKDIDDNGEIKIRLNEQMGNNLEINYYHYGTKVGRYIPIAFCPMCGRLVNKDVLKAIQKSVNTKNVETQVTMPVMPKITMPIIDAPLQEIANTIIEAINPTKLINSVTQNIMKGGMQ